MGRILLIDDEDDFRKVIRLWLIEHGFEVLEAADGKEGVRRAVESRPELILCDLLMPEMDGYAVLAALRSDEKLAETPVIFLTGQAEPAEVRQGMNLGADDYLTKPVNLEDLINAIKARLARALAHSRAKVEDTFLVKTLAGKRLVKIQEITHILAYGEYSWVYWDKSEKGALLRKSLKQWQSELPREQFIRVHRRAIVNLAFMDRVERLPAGRLQIHLRDRAEPILVSLSQIPVLNRKLKTPRH